MNDGAQKNERRHQVERLLPDAVDEDAADAAHICITVAFEVGWKRRRAGRRPTRGGSHSGNGESQYDKEKDTRLHIYLPT